MPTKITYNGKTTEVSAGDIATLPCKDYKMATDVVVEAPEPTEEVTVEEWDGSGVVIEEIASASLISFTIDGTSYQAEDGMTWAEWVESDYNTVGASYKYGDAYNLYFGDGYIYAPNTDVITNGYTDTTNTEATGPE